MEPSIPEPKTSWDLLQLTETTHEWIKKAKELHVDVDEEMRLIVQTIIDAPGSNPATGKLHEVTVVQQLLLRGMYCSRIIRKVAEAEIRCLAQAGREDPELQLLIPLINDCEQWALSQLPSNWQLGDPSSSVHRYHALKYKVNEMVSKVQSRVKSKL